MISIYLMGFHERTIPFYFSKAYVFMKIIIRYRNTFKVTFSFFKLNF